MSGGDKSHAKFAKSAKGVGSRVPRDRDGRAVAPRPPQGDDFNAEAQSGGERRDLWFGEVPKGWEVKRLASYFSERKVKVSDKDFPPLSVTKNGILPQLENVAKTDDGDNRKLVRKGDFVINSRSDRKGSSGVSEYDGSVSLINLVLQPRGGLFGAYCNYLLKSLSFVEENYRNGRGIVADLWTTRYDEMKMIKVAMPPLPEQKAIVAYLDAETGSIDKAIAAEEKMIALLQERREIVINEAVGGGERNRGWKLVPVKRVCTMQAGKNLTSLEIQQTGEYSVYGANGQRGWYGKYNCEGDFLLVGRQGALCGNVHHVHGRFWATDHALITRIVEGVDISFAYYLFTAANFNQYASQTAAQPGIAAGQILNVKIPLPPLPEQEEIVKRLDAETGKIDRAIEVKRRQIELLRERRQIVIDEAVTGKVKVA